MRISFQNESLLLFSLERNSFFLSPPYPYQTYLPPLDLTHEISLRITSRTHTTEQSIAHVTRRNHMEQCLMKTEPALLRLTDYLPMEGGLPIVADGCWPEADIPPQSGTRM